MTSWCRTQGNTQITFEADMHETTEVQQTLPSLHRHMDAVTLTKVCWVKLAEFLFLKEHVRMCLLYAIPVTNTKLVQPALFRVGIKAICVTCLELS